MSGQAVESGSFEVVSRALTLAQVREAVAGWHGDGWVCYASGIVWRRGETAGKVGEGAKGVPLSGEWLDGAVSVHLRQAEDGWLLTRITEKAGTDRIVPESLLSTEQLDGKNLRMRYRTLWRRLSHAPAEVGPDQATFPIPVWTPVLSRFYGWE